MVLVERLAVEYRFGRLAIVVRARLRVASRVLRDVAVLPHVDVEPALVVKPLRRAGATRRVEGDQVAATVARAEAAGQRAEDGFLRIVVNTPIAAEDSDQSPVLLRRKKLSKLEALRQARCNLHWVPLWSAAPALHYFPSTRRGGLLW